MNRISKIQNSTIGLLPCEQSLNEILIKINDAKLTNRTLRRYNYFKDGLKKLEYLKHNDEKFYKLMLDLWKNENLKAWESSCNSSLMPKPIYTHLCCCMTAQYRLAKK